MPRKHWYHAVEEAQDLIDDKIETDIQGYDISHDAIKASMENARLAEVDHLIHFQQRALQDLSHRKKYGFIITNPPYGQRLDTPEEMPELYRDIGTAYKNLDSWSMYLITAYEDAHRYIGKKADKNRKIYNGICFIHSELLHKCFEWINDKVSIYAVWIKKCSYTVRNTKKRRTIFSYRSPFLHFIPMCFILKNNPDLQNFFASHTNNP